jgi:hypothetical protein
MSETSGMKIRMSTMQKLRTAFARRNLLATAFGALKGGAIPAGTFCLYHLEMQNDPWQAKGVIVLGGLVYSAKTVYGWCRKVFRREDGTADTWKALGWCAGVEGFMTCSSTFALNVAALVVLVLINAIATGVDLVMEDEAARAAPPDSPSALAPGVEEVAGLRAEVAAFREAQLAREAEVVSLLEQLRSVRSGVADPGALAKAARPRRKKSAGRRDRTTATTSRIGSEPGGDLVN